MTMRSNDAIHAKVRERYGNIASSKKAGCGCSSSCCAPRTPGAKQQSARLGYSGAEFTTVPAGANLGLGCGNPHAMAMLKKGEIVLDLGCGGGFDCFLAAKQVGRRSKVIGVDMTPEMISKARANARKGGYANVEFRLGEIEHLPVADKSVNIVMSNCVINLSPEKQQVYRETWRVLKPRGRLAIADVIAVKSLPANVRNDLEKYSGCVAGAVSVTATRRMLRAAGFRGIKIELRQESREFIKNWFPGTGLENYVLSAAIQAIK